MSELFMGEHWKIYKISRNRQEELDETLRANGFTIGDDPTHRIILAPPGPYVGGFMHGDRVTVYLSTSQGERLRASLDEFLKASLST